MNMAINKLNKTILSAAFLAAIVVPGSANAIQVVGKQLEIYGKVHVSADVGDNDRSGSNSQNDFSFSSNSSRIGFKGEHPINNWKIIYKLEQEVNFDRGGGDTFSTRNTYIGAKGSFGTLLGGYHDTPFKDVGSKWGLFGDTVADRRAILGATALSGNKFNNRGKNAIMYISNFKPVEVRVMYSADLSSSTSSSGALDNNNNDTVSASIGYKTKMFRLGLAYENESKVASGNDVDGWRAAASGKWGAFRAGLIYENLNSNTAEYDRTAWGINAGFKVTKATEVRAQYLKANDYKNVSDSGGNIASIGVFNKIDKQTSIYAAYTRTDNDSNAKFQGVDGGHGDEIKTDLGGSPSAFSAGLVFKF